MAIYQLSAVAQKLGIDIADGNQGSLKVYSPIDGQCIAGLTEDSGEVVRQRIDRASQAFAIWKNIPAPQRGELIRLFGDELRHHKEDLGTLVTIECGKILAEGQGEVQEMIDICDFALGLSRQLYGLTIVSERPGHKMSETWHPLGVVGVISAFNFPVAVWAWNFALAVVCGNSVIWKPSEQTPLCAQACLALFHRAFERFIKNGGAQLDPKQQQALSAGLAQVIIGGREAGEILVDSPQVALVSATGSTAMGRSVGPREAQRFGRSLLELGGNNAMIVRPTADLQLALRAIVFSAVGTAGQRCTSLRRLLVHSSIYPKLMDILKKAYNSVPIGNPLNSGIIVGPLVNEAAFTNMQAALKTAQAEGAKVTGGQRVDVEEISVAKYPNAFYVQPALVEHTAQTQLVCNETFAPILYCLQVDDLEEAISLQNDVPQGLSSSIFTTDLREAEVFLSARGSDCGIANVNIGPSGAEIGGAFGGEKETGGGRESGSDSWKNYMRRSTSTVNYSRELPLAQGIDFNLDV